MTFVNVGSLEAQPGRGAELLAILIRPKEGLPDAGCLSYEVGLDPDAPDTVLVTEMWISADAHRDSLALPSVQAAIAEARPLMTGVMGGFRFESAGSPLSV